MPFGASSNLFIAPLPFPLDDIGPLWSFPIRLLLTQVIGEGPAALSLRLDTTPDKTEKQLARRREQHQQRNDVAEETGEE